MHTERESHYSPLFVQLHLPYDWVASVLPLQLLRIGKVVIAGVPAEFTLVSMQQPIVTTACDTYCTYIIISYVGQWLADVLEKT